jgi:integrase
MRPRKTNKHLPPCVYIKHGAYYYVKAGRWHPLGRDLREALLTYARLASAQSSGMAKLIEDAYPVICEGLADSTKRQYRIAADKLKPVLIEFAPEQVTPRDVAAIRQHFSDHPAMANRILSFLRSVFNFALDRGMVESNPCIGVKRNKEKARDRYLTDAEYLAIRNASPADLQPIIDMAYLTGQRIGDVLAIRLSDITPEGIEFRTQKTHTRLLVQMTPACRRADRCGPPGSPTRSRAITDCKRQGHDAQALGGHTTRRVAVPVQDETRRPALRLHDDPKDMWNAATIRAGIADANLHDLPRRRSPTPSARDTTRRRWVGTRPRR